MNIYLSRHAQTTKGTDPELSLDGIRLCKKMAPFFSSVQTPFAFCSPKKRTQQTAKLLYPHLEFIDDPRLITPTPSLLDEWKHYPCIVAVSHLPFLHWIEHQFMAENCSIATDWGFATTLHIKKEENLWRIIKRYDSLKI